MHTRVLIVGTVPYNEKSTSRAFDSYFHNWKKENLAQIFSNTKTPCKGHCGTLYQITDYRLLYKWFGKKEETGVIFKYDDLPDTWDSNDLELNNTTEEQAYRIGRSHNSLTHLLRGVLWRKKFWCAEKLNKWLDDFKPECVFLSFSDDYFIPQIAYYVAQRYNIPIVSSIGDDYFFNKHFSLNPIYQLYKETYKALIRKVLSWKGNAIYIGDKIRDKYNSEFGLDGDTVYLTSTVCRREFQPICKVNPLITYFGNIRMGRNKSLCAIATALGEIDPNYKIEVYSNEEDPKHIGMLVKHNHVLYGGSIPYAKVKEKMESSDITVIVEGFSPEEVELSRYSLSTKAADALASGVSIVAFGSQECGIIEYLYSTSAAAVCTKKEDIKSMIEQLILDERLQRQYYQQAIKVTDDHHNLKMSTSTFESVIERAIRRN